MIKLLLIFYPLYNTLGENIPVSYPFGSQSIFFNPAIIGSEFNPSYTISLLGTNLALTNNALSISLYNDIMSANGDSLNRELKDKILKYSGNAWKLNHLSYFSPFSFSIGRFAMGFRLIQGSFMMIPEPWLRLLLYGNELDKVYEANKNNTALQVLNLFEIKTGFGNGIFLDPNEKFRLLYGLSFSFYISGPYLELSDINVKLNSSSDAITGNDFLSIRADTNFFNFGYSMDFGFGFEYKKLFNFSFGFSNIISNLNFSKGVIYSHRGNLDSLYIGEGIDYDTIATDDVDTIPRAFSVKLPLIFKFSSFYRHPEDKYRLFFAYEQGFKNTALSTKTPRISLGSEYFVHPRIPLRAGFTFGGYEGFAFSLGFGIISRDISSINIGISQHRGIFTGSRGISLSFLTEFHSPFKGKFKFRIIDSLTNKPIANAVLRLIDTKDKKVFEGLSDVNGEIKGEIKGGKYKFDVEADDYYSKSGPFVIKSGEKREEKVLLKTKFGILTVYVKNKDNEEPLSDVDVTIQYKEKTTKVKTDRTGTLKFKLEKGEYTFRFEHPDYVLKTERISIEPGTVKEVDVFLSTKWGIVKGKVFNAQTMETLSGDIEIYPENKDSLIQKIVSPSEGTYEVKLLEGIYLFKVKVPNYIPQAAYVQVKGGAVLIKDFPMLKEKMVFTFRNIYFDFNKATIRPESYPILDSISIMLKDNPTIIVEIGGHTDERGSNAYNKKLSQGRADAVRIYFIDKHGIDPSRLIAIGYGEDRPVIRNAKTEDEHQMNRRVEFKILGEKK
ncbi:MAG: OmpA family protein [candidate division WOR-3 bacterium]